MTQKEMQNAIFDLAKMVVEDNKPLEEGLEVLRQLGFCDNAQTAFKIAYGICKNTAKNNKNS